MSKQLNPVQVVRQPRNGQVKLSQAQLTKTKLAGNAECKVLYYKAKDMVELEVGGTSLRFEACNFFMMNEMMRKAAAKLIMQTELRVREINDQDYSFRPSY
jgi:hypothetical protein